MEIFAVFVDYHDGNDDKFITFFQAEWQARKFCDKKNEEFAKLNSVEEEEYLYKKVREGTL